MEIYIEHQSILISFCDSEWNNFVDWNIFTILLFFMYSDIFKMFSLISSSLNLFTPLYSVLTLTLTYKLFANYVLAKISSIYHRRSKNVLILII